METITFDTTMGMDDFINRISRKVAEIKGVNGSISDVSVSGYLIRSLPKEYDLYKPLLNSIRADIGKLKLELLKADTSTKEEKLRAKPPAFNPDTIPKAIAVQGGSENQSNNKPKYRRDPNAYYTFYKFKGYNIKDCTIYKLAQDYFNSNGKDSNSTNQEALSAPSTVYKKAYTAKKSTTGKSTFSTLLSSQLHNNDFADIWYIDSGITDHFTGSKSSFITYKNVELFPITLGNESIILIKGKGTIILSTTPELKIQLNNILYSP
jgi:hypothetical protein